MIATANFNSKQDGKIKCFACAKECLIDIGDVGYCGVRENIEGTLKLLNYGKIASLFKRKIEEIPFVDFLPGSNSLIVGLVGSTFRETYNRNWDVSEFAYNLAKQSSRLQANKHVIESGYDFSPDYLINYCKEQGCQSIVFGIGDPTVVLEYVFDVAKLAHLSDIKIGIMCNGYFTRHSLEACKGLIDGVNINLKSFNNDFYIKHCKAKLSIVKDNIRWFYESGVHLELSTYIIPDENDKDYEIESAAKFVAEIDPGIPWHLKRYIPDYRILDKQPTSLERLEKLRNVALKIGLKNVIIHF